MLLGKLTDLILYNLIGTVENLTLTPYYLTLTKFRWFLILGTIIPVFCMLISVWLNEYRRKQIIMNTVFIIISIILILIAQNYTFLQVLTSVMMFPLMIIATITFVNLHLHKRLPQFNSLLMSFAYIAYLISQAMRPILMNIGEQFTWIAELIETIIWTIMGLAFIVKPKYGVKKNLLIAK